MSRERTALLTLAACQFCNIMDFMIMMPLGPQLMRIFSITAQQFSLLVAVYSVSAGVAGFFMAFFADRFDRKRLLILMYAGFTLGTLACALAPTYWFLLLARLITGLFGGVISSIVLAIVSDLVPIQRRGEAMGIVNTAFATASVFGVPFGLFLASLLSWHAPFLFIVAVCIPVLFLLGKVVPKIDAHLGSGKVKPLKVLQNIWDNPNQVRALTFICVLMFAHFIVIPFLSPSMVANVGFTEGQLTWIYFLGGGVSIVTGPWIGRVADRIGKHRMFFIGGVAVLVPIFLITHMGPISLPLALVVTTFFFICSGGRFIPALAISSGTVLPKNRGSFMSLQSCLQHISMGLASFLAGLIVKVDPATGALLRYPFVGYISIMAGLFCLYLIRRVKVIDQDAQGVGANA